MFTAREGSGVFGYTLRMRIDPLLCQKILIAVESDPNAGTGQFIRITVDDYDPASVAHHIKYLWDEKLVTGQNATNFQSPYPENHGSGHHPCRP